jgi:hypothetical protein
MPLHSLYSLSYSVYSIRLRSLCFHDTNIQIDIHTSKRRAEGQKDKAYQVTTAGRNQYNIGRVRMGVGVLDE